MKASKLLQVSLIAVLLTESWAAAAQSESTKLRLMPQLGHAQGVVSVAFSPNGNQILTGGNDQAAVLWDIDTGREVRRFSGFPNTVWSVAFADKGNQVLAGSYAARLFDVQTGKEIMRFKPGGSVSAMAVSPDGSELLTTDMTAARLWDLRTGAELQVFEGNKSAIDAVAFSPDGKLVATGGGKHGASWETEDDFTVRLFNAKTGKEVRQFVGHTGKVSAVSFSPPDGKYLLSASEQASFSRLWEVATGREVGKFQGSTDEGTGALFSPDGKYVVTSSRTTITLWDAATMEKVREFKDDKHWVNAVAFSPDGKQLVSAGSDKTARLWDVQTGSELRRFEGRTYGLSAAAFSSDGLRILTAGSDNMAHMWDAETGSETQRYEGHDRGCYAGYLDIPAVAFSNDDQRVLTGGNDGTARLWDANTGEQLQVFKGHEKDAKGYCTVGAVAFSAEDRFVLTGGDDGTARLWDANTGRQLRLFKGHEKDKYGYSRVGPVAFLPDGRVLTGGKDSTARVWNVDTGQEVRRFEGWEGSVTAFSPDGKMAMVHDRKVELWDLEVGRQVCRFEGWRGFAAFSPDGSKVLTASIMFGDDPTAFLWDAATCDELQRLEGHTAALSAAAFSPDGTKVLTVGSDRTARIWCAVERCDDAKLGQELARLLSFDDGTWAVVDSAGRFDASNGGDIGGLHWVHGLEPIKLSQLKERYYEPGLLRQIIKGQALRTVERFNERGIDLFPEVTIISYPSPANPTLRLRLKNRGGGIGRVAVFVNNKEHTEDARPDGSDSNANVLEFPVDLADSPLMIPGAENDFKVVAYNRLGYLSSRPRGRTKPKKGSTGPAVPPTLWAVVAGISDYRGGDNIDLSYASKDAEDFALALEIAANGHGGFESVEITRLTDKTTPATRKNLEAAFKSLQRAKSTDILVIYLAGHGVTWGGADGDYYYLLQEAMSLEFKKGDEALREQVSVSSRELTELIKAVPALKQVLVLDTCASGKLLESLTASRAVSPSQTRSLERMKDRTGMFVLAGSAADAESYEATPFAQGLLTYSLLEGMKGAALRDDEFVDVVTLLSHAVDRVPQLAAGVGGLQQPRLSIPGGGESFDLGQLKPAQQNKIPLAQERPVVLLTSFQDKSSFQDNLKLAAKVNGALRDVASRSNAPLVFLKASEFSNAYMIAGRYTIGGSTVELTVKVARNNKQVGTFKVQGRKTALPALVANVVRQAQKIIVGN